MSKFEVPGAVSSAEYSRLLRESDKVRADLSNLESQYRQLQMERDRYREALEKIVLEETPLQYTGVRWIEKLLGYNRKQIAREALNET